MTWEHISIFIDLAKNILSHSSKPVLKLLNFDDLRVDFAMKSFFQKNMCKHKNIRATRNLKAICGNVLLTIE